MRIFINFFSFFLLLLFMLPSANSQTMYGFLYDKEGNPILGEEVMLEIIICKNGDELFTKTETVMTDNTFGAFSSDLTIEFGIHGAVPGDKIEYSLKFTHGGETITTEKKLWPVVFMSNVSLASEVSSHSLIADHALTADNAMTAQNAQNAVVALSANEAMSAINADNALHALMADAASTASQADFALDAEHANTADEAAISTTTVNYVPIQNALPNDGDQGILLANNSGGDILIENIEVNNQNDGIDILSNSYGEFTFTNTPIPPDGQNRLITVSNGGGGIFNNGSVLITDDAGPLNINSSGGNVTLTPDPFAGALNSVPGPGIWNVSRDEQNNVSFSPTPFITDPNTGVTALSNLLGELVATGPFTSARLNFQNAYGGMFVGAVCADDFFANKSPLLNNIEIEKSGNALSKNNAFWQEPEEGKMGFIENLKSTYPELVREIEIDKDGKLTTDTYVSYLDLIPLLSKAISDQSDIIESQQKKIEELTELVELLIENLKQ